MLFNNLTTERRASLLVKNSEFYIEIAKFVQAYTTIVKNPNEFLTEVGEEPIDMQKVHLTWEQLVKIMQSVDLGFKSTPTRMDLVVYYNYALEMGSVKALDRKIASVDQVAEAQKHYYNFIDEEKTIAEEEYIKQKKIYDARKREMSYVDSQISLIKSKNVLCMIALFMSVMIGMLGIVSFFVDNVIASSIGKILPIWKAQYIGGIILIAIMFLLFWLFNHLYMKTKYEYVKLKSASLTIFAKEDELLLKQSILKKKLDEVSRDYEVIIREINDKTKKFDVKHNIEVLKATNKFYQKLCETQELSDIAEKAITEAVRSDDDDFAPIKLSKEQEENIRGIKKEIIGLQGQIDTEAYNEKFEKSEKKEETKEEQEQKAAEQEEKEQKEQTELEQKIKEAKQDQERKGFQDSMDYVKDLLGLNQDNTTKEK